MPVSFGCEDITARRADRPRSSVVRPVLAEPRREIDPVVRAGRMRPPAVAAMLDVLRSVAPRYAAAP
jgi:hypothetical protein